MRAVTISASHADVNRDVLKSLDELRDGPYAFKFGFSIGGKLSRLRLNTLIGDGLRVVYLRSPT